MKLIESAKIPVLLSKEHTYKVASEVHDIVVKIGPLDKGKAAIAENLVMDYVDVGKILENIK
jgi:BioD-like phosphotransacetylase family protein